MVTVENNVDSEVEGSVPCLQDRGYQLLEELTCGRRRKVFRSTFVRAPVRSFLSILTMNTFSKIPMK